MSRYDGYVGRGSGRQGFGRYDRQFRPEPRQPPYDRHFQPERGRGPGTRYPSYPPTGYDRDFAPREFRRGSPRAPDPFGRTRLQRSGPWPAAGHDLVDHDDYTDEEIRGAVLATMEEDSWIISDRIDVSVEDGVVTLRGEVDDYMEARYAWDDAWESEGVRGVINHLTVRTGADQP